MSLAAAPALTAARRPLLLPPGAAAKSAPATIPDDAPTVGISTSIGNGEAAMAIVGLDPSKTTDFPSPPGSRQASFSAGPQLRPTGGSGNTGAQIVVPGLLAQGGAKDAQPTLVASVAAPTSRESLLAAARLALHPPAPDIPPAPGAARVTAAPDPRLSGRVVYTVAIQMPNVTSYSGSWLVWFAEREPLPGSPAVNMRAPLPLRKVDPKYIAAAAAERVEGKVRLAAVIRKDGRVDAVALLRHLDDRLDRSASEALAKWEFEPALRNGTAVDVDCVFEIPFRLAPRPAK
jgi:TonB family protein